MLLIVRLSAWLLVGLAVRKIAGKRESRPSTDVHWWPRGTRQRSRGTNWRWTRRASADCRRSGVSGASLHWVIDLTP